MAIYSLKKSYLLKNLQEVDFEDLWGDHGIFTTMWIFGKPPKILFFENHLKNLIMSLKKYGIKKRSLHKDILKTINKNLSRKTLRLPNELSLILFGSTSGTKDYHKGFDLLEKSLEKLQKINKKIGLVIFGEDEPENKPNFDFLKYLNLILLQNLIMN